MKLLMLCREPRIYSCRRLKSVAEQRGYQLDILDPNRFLLKLNPQSSKSAFELFYQHGEIFDLNRPTPESLLTYAGVLPRFGTSSTEMGCRVLRHFEGLGVPVLNSSHAFSLARDKWQSLQQLVLHNIPVPNTLLQGELVSVSAGITQLTLPTVIKTLSGSQGVGVMLGEQHSSTASILETLRQAKVETLLQTFIPEAKGQDIRAFVIGEKVVASMQRQGASGEFRANIHRGGSASPITLSASEQQLAINAAKAIGLEVAGVDLIRTAQGLAVLEVNASPGLEMIEQVSQLDIAGMMIDHLLQTHSK